MTLRIQRVVVEPVRVTPAEAVLLVRVGLTDPTATGEVRGKLVGPRRPGVTTVEVAYPLRSVPGEGSLTGQVVIPEPNLGTPAAPFRYDGTVEVWQDGARLDSASFSVELRTR